MTEVHSALMIELLSDPDTDDRALYEATERLRNMLLDLDVEAVERAGVSGNLGSSKGYHVRIGELIVLFTLRPEVLRSVVSLAGREWPRRVKLTLHGNSLEITGPHSVTQERAIDLWIAHHTNPE